MLHLSLDTADSPDDKDAQAVRRQLATLGGLVAKSAKVIVVSGAGVSCSCGIPDFRSANGLYNLVKSRYPTTVVTGKDLFSSALFRSAESTSLFFSFIAELKREVDGAVPSRTHRFVRRLEERGKLVRSYTQNIDGLEKRAGVQCSSSRPGEGAAADDARPSMFSAAKVDPSKWPSSSAASSSRSPSPPPSSLPSAFGSTSTSPGPPAGPTRIPPPALDRKTTKNVQLHGDLHALRCTVCAASYAFAGDWVDLYASGDCVACPACEERVGGRVARGQRALATGVLRPGIVLYDENHPSGDLIGDLQSYDLQRSPDLLLVLGTSLKVHGLKRLVKELAKAVHALPPTKARPDGGKGRVVFVNKTAPGKEWDGVFDTWVEGECDRWVDGVEREWRRVRGRDFEAQTTLAGLGKTVKGAAAGATAAKPVKGEPKQTAAAAAGPKSIKGLPKALDKPAAGPMGPPRSPVKKAQQQQPSAAASSSTPKPKAKPAPSPARSMAPSSPLPAFSSPAHAHAHVLSPAQRAVNVPAPNGRPALSPAQKAAGARSPTKKARMLSAGGISKGKARAYASDDDLSTDDNDDDDDKVLLVERGPDGSVKLSPVGRFAALPSPSTHAHASSSSSTPRRPPPPPPAFASHPTPGRSTPRAPLPPTAGGARKRAPGTPVDGRRSPFVVRPPPATAVLLADASAKRRRQRADGRAKEAARRSVLEAAGVVPRAEVIELD